MDNLRSLCMVLSENTWWFIPRIVSGAHNPGDFNGISGGNVHLYLGWTNPLTIRGMNHQVSGHTNSIQDIYKLSCGWETLMLTPKSCPDAAGSHHQELGALGPRVPRSILWRASHVEKWTSEPCSNVLLDYLDYLCCLMLLDPPPWIRMSNSFSWVPFSTCWLHPFSKHKETIWGALKCRSQARSGGSPHTRWCPPQL